MSRGHRCFVPFVLIMTIELEASSVHDRLRHHSTVSASAPLIADNRHKYHGVLYGLWAVAIAGRHGYAFV